MAHPSSCVCDLCLEKNGMWFVPDSEIKPLSEDELWVEYYENDDRCISVWDALNEAQGHTLSSHGVRGGIKGTLYQEPEPLTDEQIQTVLMNYYGGRPQITIAEVRAQEMR